MELKRVVVTGLGAVTPLGNTIPEFWDSIINGKSGASLITRFDTSLFKTKFACQVKDFDPNQYMDRKEARKMDIYAQMAMVAAKEAIEHSGLDLDVIDKDEVGVIFSAGIGGITTFEQEIGYYYNNVEQGQIQSFLHSKNDIGYCSGTDFYGLWLQRSELFNCICLCIIDKCFD